MSVQHRNHLAQLVRDSLPNVTLVGTTGVIPHTKVEFVHSLIAQSAIPARIDAWFAEDRAAKSAGGRPRLISTTSILTLLLLASSEQQSQEVTEIARLIHERLGDDSLGLLAISRGPRTSALEWYGPVRFALNRVINTVDPKPGRRNKHLTKAEYDAVLEKRAGLGSDAKQARLDWVTNTMLEATMKTLPDEVWAEWKGDLTIDATVVAAYGKKGAPWQPTSVEPSNRFQAVEPDAGWYLRNAQHTEVKEMKYAKKAVYGWDVTLAAMTRHDPESIGGFPQLIMGIGMTAPGRDLIHTARRVVEFIHESGHPAGRLTGDRGYLASAKAEDFQIPLRLLGYDMVSDYKIDQLGVIGGYEGAILVEGAFYCPSMPRGLVNATKLYREGKVTWETWQKRIEQRKQYRLRPKQKPDEAGNVPMVCPARGSGATATCPLAAACTGAAYDAKTAITPPAENKRGRICTNKASVKFPIEAGAKYLQKYAFGTKEWRDIYRMDRSTIEGVNGNLKTAGIALDDAASRRVRGYTAQYLFITMLVATEDLRRIQAYRNELTQHRTVEAREAHFAKKQLRQANRKKDTRVLPWDAFAQKAKAEQAESASA